MVTLWSLNIAIALEVQDLKKNVLTKIRRKISLRKYVHFIDHANSESGHDVPFESLGP